MNWSLERHGAVAALTFDRPPRNMMSFAAMGELLEHLEVLAADATTTVVVLLSARPGYFVAHGDLEDLVAIGEGRPPSGPANVWGRAIRTIEEMPQPVVAAIDGQAWGGGCEIVSACTVRIASPAAHFAQPEIDLGIIPGAGGTVRLARLVGHGTAMELILTGRVITAQEAHGYGLVQVVLPTEGFRDRALAWVGELARKPAAGLAAAKAAVHFADDHPRRDALRFEAERFLPLQASEPTLALQREVLRRYAAADPVDLSDLLEALRNHLST